MNAKNLILLLLLVLAGCNNSEKTRYSDEIAVSILPQEYFVRKIAGEHFRINVMIPPGASPATYEPTPAQLTSLTRTRLYMKIGYTGFEMTWMEKLVSANSKMAIADLSEGVDLIMEEAMHEPLNEDHEGHHHGGIDPHIWLSPSNVKIIAGNIYKALLQYYPEYKEEFSANLGSFMTELDSLNRYISEQLRDLTSRSFFTYHPSLSYFSRDYNLVQYPLELGGKTPSPAHLKEMIDIGKEENIGLVFLQMQFDQKNAEVLARELNAEIVQINPLDPEWYQQMKFIADKLNANLK